MEVVEIGCPAEHETTAEHVITLPTAELRPDRVFEGQRFVRHTAAATSWEPWRLGGFQCRDTGIGVATDGLAGVRVVRPDGETVQMTTEIDRPATAAPGNADVVHDGELLFWFVLSGTATLHTQGRPDEPLGKGAAVAIPAGASHCLTETSGDLEFLEVTLPAALEIRTVAT